MASQTLVTLSLLKVGVDFGNKDYLDQLTPLIFEVIRAESSDQVQDRKIAEEILGKFGLRIPDTVINLVLRRLSRKGFFHKEHGVYFRTEKKIPDGFSFRQDAAREQIIHLVSAYSKFVADKFSVRLNELSASEEIIAFLREFSIECLRAYTFGSPLPEIDDGEKKNPRYRVGSFVKSARQHDQNIYESFILLTKAVMSANALICPDLESIEKKFGDVRFYFDTSIILSTLGLQTHAERRSASELIELLGNLKGKVCCFEQTLDEIDGILYAVIRNYGSHSPESKIDQAIVDSNISKSDLVLLKETLREKIEGLGVQIEKSPKYSSEFQISETDLEASIRDEVHHSKENALRHDVNCIRSIYAIRKGRSPRRLEDAIAVFVTANDRLAKAADLYGREYEVFKEVSSTITDYSLANIAWLKAPMGASSLPETELLALASAMMEPDKDFWGSVVIEAKRLADSGDITANELQVFRTSTLMKEGVLDLTQGRDQAFTPSAVKQVIQDFKRNILSERDSEVLLLKKERDEAKRQLYKLEERETQQKNYHYWRIEKTALLITSTIKIAMAAIIFIITIRFDTEIRNAVVFLFSSKLGVLLFLIAVSSLVYLDYLSRSRGDLLVKLSDWISVWYKKKAIKKVEAKYGIRFSDQIDKS